MLWCVMNASLLACIPASPACSAHLSLAQTGSGKLSQAELCAAQKLAGTFNDPYQGPCLAGVPTAAALLANCSEIGQVAAPPAYPGGHALMQAAAAPHALWLLG